MAQNDLFTSKLACIPNIFVIYAPKLTKNHWCGLLYSIKVNNSPLLPLVYVDDFLLMIVSLEFIPDWFVISKTLEKFHDALLSILYF